MIKIKRSIYLLLISISISVHCIENIVVIIPSFNNATCYKKNLNSVFMQDHPQFRVIYIDDCSTDGTGNLVEQYIQDHQLHNQIQFIRNNYNRKALANIYAAVHTCADSDLIVLLDGDDAFAHAHVLSTIERIHRERNAWVSYAQFINVPEHKAIECGIPVKGYAMVTPDVVIQEKSYRNCVWSWSGLRSFYAWIFKQIKQEDLIDSRPPFEGKFFQVNYDNAIFFPLMEMAGIHCTFIEEVLLLRNVDTPLNDFKINLETSRDTRLYIRQKPSYPTIITPIINS